MDLLEDLHGALQIRQAVSLAPHLDQQREQAEGQEQVGDHGRNRNGARMEAPGGVSSLEVFATG
jgi:hypothetical protein